MQLSNSEISRLSVLARQFVDVPAMQWAYGAGIIQGIGSANGGMLLDPQGNAIRSQAATIMMRFDENVTP